MTIFPSLGRNKKNGEDEERIDKTNWSWEEEKDWPWALTREKTQNPNDKLEFNKNGTRKDKVYGEGGGKKRRIRGGFRGKKRTGDGSGERWSWRERR